MDEGLTLLLVGVILSASVIAALAAARTGLPVLVLFLGIGMLLGSDSSTSASSGSPSWPMVSSTKP